MNTLAGKKPESVGITLDGRLLEFDDKHTTADEVLRAGGLDPALYALIEIKKNGHTEKLSGDHPITLTEGEEFVSQRESAPVQ